MTYILYTIWGCSKIVSATKVCGVFGKSWLKLTKGRATVKNCVSSFKGVITFFYKEADMEFFTNFKRSEVFEICFNPEYIVK